MMYIIFCSSHAFVSMLLYRSLFLFICFVSAHCCSCSCSYHFISFVLNGVQIPSYLIG
ncbi:hypothetical protein C2G38_2085405 [Gigaspora rosea]|uniref:Uncharacterized protein n=1 Tax=Gigaspora rosea TaxID=44941 RepID=A0A397VF77_9GLOM|nr:hypothetical protein C2G38_2085405 [Gigaspora rosea]